MWFWWFMLVCDITVPMIQIIAGIIMWKKCPKQINRIYGYRTTRSMINMDTWIFAHNHCGQIWWKIGFIILILSVLVHIPFYNSNENVIGIVGLSICIIQVIVLIASVFPTEIALKKTFNDDGTRK